MKEKQNESTIKCNKLKMLNFYALLLDLVEKERLCRNYSEWCRLEREYISIIGEDIIINYFKK